LILRNMRWRSMGIAARPIARIARAEFCDFARFRQSASFEDIYLASISVSRNNLPHDCGIPADTPLC
jgi:hypothetical protein